MKIKLANNEPLLIERGGVICDITSRILPIYNAVDLGLPSGTLWADRNIGADNPEDAGLFFQWGDVEGFSKDSGRYCNGTRVAERNWTGDYSGTHGCMLGDNQNIPNDPYFDAAQKHMGGSWLMPTKEQFAELIKAQYTSCSVITRDNIRGLLVTSKINENTVFLPIVGCIFEGENWNTEEYYCAMYWSKTKYSVVGNAYTLDINDSVGVTYNAFYPCSMGLPIRAVQPSPSE